MSVDATNRERVCFRRAVLLVDQPKMVEIHRATPRSPADGALAAHRSAVVTYDFGCWEHAVPAHSAAITATHTPKSALRMEFDLFWPIYWKDSPAGANALAVGGVDGHRSKWSVANGLGGAWPPDRSRALPTS